MNLERLGRGNKVRVAVGVLVLLTVVGGAYLTLVEQEPEPVEISNAEEFEQMREDLDGHYILVDNIDVAHIDNFEPIGSPQDPFTGTLDGNGYTISNLTIDRPNESPVGLFGSVGNKPQGVIEDVGLEDVDVTGNLTVGGLVGLNQGVIWRSYVTGRVRGDEDSGGEAVGGLVGINRGVVGGSYATGEVSGDERVGGLVGVTTGMTVTGSYARGNVTGNEEVGGLVGFSDGEVRESYAAGNVTGSEGVGGLVGGHSDSANSDNSYWDINTTGQNESDGGTPLTTPEMTGSAARENMEGFDFEAAWRTTEDDYPILSWESERREAE